MKIIIDLLREVACSGVEVDDKRLDYVVLQVDRETWDRISELNASYTDDELYGDDRA